MKILAILLLLCIAEAGCRVRRSEPIKQEVFTPTSAAVAAGEKLYMIHCQKCHPAGEGGLGPAINSNPAPGFIKRFQVRHGLGVMPSFKKDELTREDARNIARYIRTWKNY